MLTGLILLGGGALTGRAQNRPHVAPLPTASTAAPLGMAKQPLQISIRNGNKITTAVADNQSTTITMGTPVLGQTSDPQGVYSSRPLLAVGDIKSVDSTSRTVVLRIHRELSSLPHILEANAKKKGVLEKLKAREFPPERLFFISRTTQLLDPVLFAKTPPRKTESQREQMKRIRVRLEDFHPGDRVSVYFRYNQDPEQPAGVINMIKQDPTRTDYQADYRAAPIQIRTIDPQAMTTQTRPMARPARERRPMRRLPNVAPIP